MNVKELRGILHSDMKLWEAAEDTNITPTTVTKVIDLPYGIGKKEVTLEGLNDGSARRGAVASFGEYIRGLVANETEDYAIESKARQKAAFTKDPVGVLDVFVAGPEALGGQKDAILQQISDTESHLASLRLNVRAIEALEDLYDTPAHKKAPSDD